MNAKFALALILTLHVSMSFCEAHEPPQELVAKYEAIKEKLYRRGEGLIGRMMEYFGSNPNAQMVKGHLDNLPTDPKVVAVRQVADAIRKELEPLTADIRRAALSFYDENLREHIRQPLETAIERIGSFLDQVAPAE